MTKPERAPFEFSLDDAAPAPPPPASFHAAAEALGIGFDGGDLDRIGQYLSLLLYANERMNLTRITNDEDLWHRHVLDSLTLMPYLVAANAKRVIDVGSGGGLPGLVLASVLPEVEFALLEVTGKKAAFLSAAIRELGLANAGVIADRAETVGQDEDHRETYDVAVARALGGLPVLLELTVPLVRVDGLVLAVKGERAREELEEALHARRQLHVDLVETHRTQTGTIVVFQKKGRTPKTYPRRPGDPKRQPLGEGLKK